MKIVGANGAATETAYNITVNCGSNKTTLKLLYHGIINRAIKSDESLAGFFSARVSASFKIIGI